MHVYEVYRLRSDVLSIAVQLYTTEMLLQLVELPTLRAGAPPPGDFDSVAEYTAAIDMKVSADSSACSATPTDRRATRPLPAASIASACSPHGRFALGFAVSPTQSRAATAVPPGTRHEYTAIPQYNCTVGTAGPPEPAPSSRVPADVGRPLVCVFCLWAD